MTTRRSWTTIAILVLLMPHLIGILGLFPHHAFTEGGIALRVFAVGVALFSLLTVAGLWLAKPWALWATLVVVALKATIDLYAYAIDYDRTWTLGSAVVHAAIVALVFREAVPSVRQVSTYQRVLYGSVLVFAAWVVVWGLFFPAQIGSKFPLTVPPLHARFLGAFYLSGAVLMLLAALAREWHEARVVTAVLAIWTGVLGAVTIFNLAVFNWSHGPAWFWFVVYLGFPLIASWVVWCQRDEAAHPNVEPMSGALRAYLYGLGSVVVLLALGLLVEPQAMTRMWPWSIQALVANIYAGPFLAYGLGSLYAARQRSWREVRILVYGTLVFAIGVLVSSWLHVNLFDLRSPSAWLWFGGFGLVAVVSGMFGLWPSCRSGAKKKSA